MEFESPQLHQRGRYRELPDEVYKLLNTKQESIARLESGSSLPSLSTVRKVANALDAEVEINLRPRQHSVKDGLAARPS